MTHGARRRSVMAMLVGLLVIGSGISAGAATGKAPRPEPQKAPEFVPGELLVAFEPGASERARAEVRARHGLQKVRDLPIAGAELVRIEDASHPSDRAAAVRREVAVRTAEPNYIYTADALPTDPYAQQLWGLNNTGQFGGVTDADIDAAEAFSGTSATDQFVVGVIDTGIDIGHPDLASQIWTNPGESGTDALGRDKSSNLIDDDLNGYIDDVHGWDFFNMDNSVFDPVDGDAHGTHVAGTIAATSGNGVGISGVSDAAIMPLKFLGPYGGNTASAILALDYAINMGADITNNSWGGGGYSLLLEEMIAKADAAGQLFVAAAGNNASDNDTLPHYPAGYPVANVVSVAATNDDDQLSDFSNYGATTVDVAAPGDDILSTVPSLGHSKGILVGPGTADVPYHAAYHGFGLEGVRGAAERAALVDAALDWMGAGPTSSVLLIDDDTVSQHFEEATFENAYLDALRSLGVTNVTVHKVLAEHFNECTDGPSASAMAAYDVVIWLTGAQFNCTLSPGDQQQLSSFLDGGGRLILFGMDIGYDLTVDGSEINEFLSSKLRADYVADTDATYALVGAPQTPYAHLPALLLEDEAVMEEQYYAEVLAPLAGGMSALTDGYDAYDGTSMAAPHATGTLVQILADNPGLGHLDAKATLMNQSDALDRLAGTSLSGARINLAKALGVSTDPTFELSSSVQRLSVPANGRGTLGVSLTSADGYQGRIDLSVEGLPSGVSAAFDRPSLNFPSEFSSNLTISAAKNVKPGEYLLTVVGNGSGKTQFTQFTLAITKGGGKR